MDDLQSLLNLANKKLAIATKNCALLLKAKDEIRDANDRARDAEDELDAALDELNIARKKVEDFDVLKTKYNNLRFHWDAAVAAIIPTGIEGETLATHILLLKRKAEQVKE